MFKIFSEIVKAVPIRKLDVVVKIAELRPFSSKSKNHGLTDFSKKKACKEKVCKERPAQTSPEKPESCGDKPEGVTTWRPCPDPAKQKKFSCEDNQPHGIARRTKLQVAAKSPCTTPAPSLQAPDCFIAKTQLCPRASMPGCGKARIPPRCEPKKAVRGCVRAAPPVASFSECYEFPFLPPLRSECTCLTAKKICIY
ncbi:uncharacterized protein LOC134203561 [Armigeres subalbatus]|uniref:uncharacterized protein LOC134203561 n=1 Tax=Armigeres subalbatus TaxID=124917 RepID=UPI002ED21188